MLAPPHRLMGADGASRKALLNHQSVWLEAPVLEAQTATHRVVPLEALQDPKQRTELEAAAASFHAAQQMEAAIACFDAMLQQYCAGSSQSSAQAPQQQASVDSCKSTSHAAQQQDSAGHSKGPAQAAQQQDSSGGKDPAHAGQQQDSSASSKDPAQAPSWWQLLQDSAGSKMIAFIFDACHFTAGGKFSDAHALQLMICIIAKAITAGVRLAKVVVIIDGRDPAKYPVPGSISRSQQLIGALAKVFGEDGTP